MTVECSHQIKKYYCVSVKKKKKTERTVLLIATSNKALFVEFEHRFGATVRIHTSYCHCLALTFTPVNPLVGSCAPQMRGHALGWPRDDLGRARRGPLSVRSPLTGYNASPPERWRRVGVFGAFGTTMPILPLRCARCIICVTSDVTNDVETAYRTVRGKFRYIPCTT